ICVSIWRWAHLRAPAGPRGRLGSQPRKLSGQKDAQINSAVPMHWDALRAEIPHCGTVVPVARRTTWAAVLRFATVMQLLLASVVGLAFAGFGQTNPAATLSL